MAERKGWRSIIKTVRGALGTGEEEAQERGNGAMSTQEVVEVVEVVEEVSIEVEAAPAREPAPVKEAAPKKAAAKKAAPKKAAPKKAAPKKAAPKKAAAKAPVAEELPTVKVPDESVDIRAVREGMGLTQAEFAQAYGFSIHTLRKWEQNVREPEKPTRILLMMIRDMPDVVNDYLQTISVK
ncbi:MAG: helix-turn-helix domain-containing protein [Bradymonadaceae bacterium]